MLCENAKKLLGELVEVAQKGPIRSVGLGSPSIGMTLLRELGIEYQSVRKPKKYGIVVSARRRNKNSDRNRVNLFATVPDWDISPLKSTAEILDRYGYNRNGEKRLFCTVRAGQANSQGLILCVSKERGVLEERAVAKNDEQLVVSWRIERLMRRLAASHPETFWITAQSSTLDGSEYFHYRYASHSSGADVKLLPELIEQGTITVDHLIVKKDGRVTEKGPLFKVRSRNIPLLFPVNHSFDLLLM